MNTVEISAHRARRWWLWHLCAVGSVVLLAPLIPRPDVQSMVQVLCSTTVIVAVIAGLRLNRPAHPLGWRVLLAAVTITVVSNIVWPVLQAVHVIGSSPAVDLLYYTTYPVFGLALALLPIQGRTGSRLTGLTEAGIITSGAAVLWWTMLVDPIVIDGNRIPDQFHVVAFPMLDMAIFALGIRLLIIGGFRSMSWVLIAGATGMLLIADTALFISSINGSGPPVLSVVGWLLANAMLGAAALHPSMTYVAPVIPDGDLPDNIGASRIYLATVVATPIIAGAYLLRESWTTGVGAADIVVPAGSTALTSALVVVRMRQLNKVARSRAMALQQSLDSEAALQEELRHRAQHDVLTGLPNRSLLYERITAALATGAPGALLVLDLDDFKDVNDRFGHTMGDDLLVAVARRLEDLLDGRALVARLDSDEFAILFDSAGPSPARPSPARSSPAQDCPSPAQDRSSSAQDCAEEVLVAMRRPVLVQGHDLFAAVSIGLRHFDPGLLTSDVLRDTYLALHSAKEAGRDQLIVFDVALREKRQAAAQTVERLRGAIERDELLVHYQPLVRLTDERYVGVEALIRWQPAGERMIPPDQFIPAAEDSGLIVGIGAWVLRESCRTVAGWHRQHGAVVSVNVSPRQLREPDFATMVLDALRSSALPPPALILEITEGVLVASGQVTEQAIGHLTTLRAHGVRVAVDDFGTGYSSLAYLRDLPIDHIKIDRSFMPAPGETDPAPRTMVKAIIDLASGLKLGTIAEGVETAEQVALLRELGCERAQGYFFSRPVPAPEAAALLAASAATSTHA